MSKLEMQLDKYDNILIGINNAKYRLLDSKKKVFTKDDIHKELTEIWEWHWKEREKIMSKLMNEED